MKLFVSYASARRDLAEPLCLALEADGHDVFFDRGDLPAGQSYHDRIRRAIDGCECFIFLISPESVKKGSYARTELELAQTRWPRPHGRVLPVMAVATPFADIPPYLGVVTVLQPQGNLAADVAAHVARMVSVRPPWLLPALAGAVLVAAAGLAFWWRTPSIQGPSEQAGASSPVPILASSAAAALNEGAARATALQTDLRAATGLCDSGSFKAAWQSFEQVRAQAGVQAGAMVERPQADCAMRWLRNMSVLVGSETFAQLVDPMLPLLGREAARAQGERLGDLQAHIGWGEALRGRGGVPTDPLPHYQRAVQADANNPYAHAMWAHTRANRGAPDAEVVAHFEKALATPRARDFVRRMQLAVASNQGRRLPLVLASLNQGRLAGEPVPDSAARLYRAWCEWELPIAADDRSALLDALATDDALAMIDWLQAAADVPKERLALWKLCHSAYLVRGGRTAEARATIAGVLKSLGPAGAGGSYERWAKVQLAMLNAKP